MRAPVYIAVFVALLAASAAAASADEQGFVSLFNGKDLTGWKTASAGRWIVKDGTLTLRDRSDGREHNLQYLWAEETYDNFVLDLEFKVPHPPQGANSGIFLRTSDSKDPVYTGIEIQVSNSYGRETCNRGGTAGAVYDCLAPTKNAIKPPGQWNRFQITCDDNKIKVVLNGQQVIDMDLDRWTEPRKNPDGSPNKFPRAVKDFARKGYVGLQDHGLPVWYRNVKIKRLKSKDAAYTLVPETHGMVLNSPEGQVVFRYMTKKPAKTNLAANSVCCFHPLNTPSGERVTDLAPGDHHHHRGVFLAWHTLEFWEKADFSGMGPTAPTHGWDITRGDFWGWGQYAPTLGRVIKNRHVKLLNADSKHADVQIRNEWWIDDQVMMDEVTLARVSRPSAVYVIDLDYRLTPKSDLVLNRTAFGGFCVRARNDGDSYYATPQGKVTLPDPHYSAPELNWPPADWYDYTIKLNNGKTVGLATYSHPDNPPATWHNPRYVWMVNPCITAAKAFEVPAGQTLRLRYRLVVHDGPTPVDLLNQLRKSYEALIEPQPNQGLPLPVSRRP